jgi:Flp pilus assembly secretin CpaC
VSIKTAVRGSTVEFNVRFYDTDGVRISPASANVRLTFSQNSVSNNTVLVLASASEVVNSSTNSTVWSNTFNTTNCDVGDLSWHAWTTGTAEDGVIRIVANPANPEP